MADLPYRHWNFFLCGHHAVKEAVQAGTTKDVRQQRLYQQWNDLCFTLSVNPDIQDPYIPSIKLFQVYGHWVRHAHYSKRRVEQLGKDYFYQAWWAIVSTHLLDGLPDL